jgi:anti-sigma regulatory factor (Ser/Thr protein kinase)
VEPSAQIVIPAKLDQLRTLEQWVQRIAAQFLLPEPLVHRIDLCLTELVTNVVSYGYPDGNIGTIGIRFWREPESITIRIDDDAAVFDPTRYQPPDLPRALADAPAGGRGIRLARSAANQDCIAIGYRRNVKLLIDMHWRSAVCRGIMPVRTGEEQITVGDAHQLGSRSSHGTAN